MLVAFEGAELLVGDSDEVEGLCDAGMNHGRRCASVYHEESTLRLVKLDVDVEFSMIGNERHCRRLAHERGVGEFGKFGGGDAPRCRKQQYGCDDEFSWPR